MTEPGYLSMKQLAIYSSIPESTLRKHLPKQMYLRMGRKVLIKKTDFDFWMRRQQRKRREVSPMVKRLADEIMGAA